MNALIVDDSRTLRKFLSKILRELGFDTVEAADGQQALNRLEENGDLDLALVDWNMPVMDGYEFVCNARAKSENEGLCIMMVTTENELDKVVKALDAGANEYLMKPFTKEDLLSKLTLMGVI